MKTLKRKILGPVVSFAVAALMIGAAMGIRSRAHPDNLASNTSPISGVASIVESIVNTSSHLMG